VADGYPDERACIPSLWASLDPSRDWENPMQNPGRVRVLRSRTGPGVGAAARRRHLPVLDRNLMLTLFLDT